MIIILFDTETTNLVRPGADIKEQPHIIEIGLIKINQVTISDKTTLHELDRISTLVKPPIILDEEEHKRITKLTNTDLANAPSFPELYDQLCNFFIGANKIVCHNLAFDMGVLVSELTRMNAQFAFPYPPEQQCSVQSTFHLRNRRLNLKDAYEMATGKPLAQTHRAIDDTEALFEVYKWMCSSKFGQNTVSTSTAKSTANSKKSSTRSPKAPKQQPSPTTPPSVTSRGTKLVKKKASSRSSA